MKTLVNLFTTLLVALFLSTEFMLADTPQTGSDGFKWIHFTQNGLEGAKDEKGKVIIPAKYIAVSYDNSCFSVKNNIGQIGQFTRTGKVIFPAYKYTHVFQIAGYKDSPFIVIGDRYGVIGHDGTMLLEDMYTAIKVYGDSQSGYNFMLWKDGYMGVADMNGKILISPTEYNAIGRILGEDGKLYFVCIRYGNGSAVCNKSGKKIIDTKYFMTVPAWENNKMYFEITEGNATGKLDLEGNLIRPLTAPQISKISTINLKDNLYSLWRAKNNKYFVRNPAGKVIIEPKYDWVAKADDEHFQVWDKTNVGIIDINSNIIVYPEKGYISVGCMKDCINAYTKDGKQSIIGYDGKEIYPARHKNVSLNVVNNEWIADTLISFRDQSFCWGIKNIKEKIFVQPIWDDLNFLNSKFGFYFEVFKDGKVGLVDTKGNIILTPEFQGITASEYKDYPFFFVNTGYMGVADIDGNILISPEIFDSMEFNPEKKIFIGIAGKRKCTFSLKGELLSDNEKDVQFDEYVSKGDKAFDNKKYKEAAKFYGDAITINTNAALYFNRGCAYYNINMYSEAISDFEAALQSNPSDRVRDRSLDLIEKAEHYQYEKEQRQSNIAGAIFGLALSVVNYGLQTHSYKKSKDNRTDNYHPQRDNSTTIYSSDYSDSDETSFVNPSKKQKCGFCGGKGSIVEYTANYGINEEPWCDECGKKVVSGHYHKKCTKCNGSGEY